MPFTPSGLLRDTMAEPNFARAAAAESDTPGKASPFRRSHHPEYRMMML
jgi:hypothetical protein